jgi:hypothetical protein
MKNKDLLNTVSKSVIAAAIIAASIPTAALAQNVDLSSTVTTLQTNIAVIPKLITAVFYILGILLLGIGIKKFKDHAENPGQNPLGKALGPTTTGAALLVVPSLSTWLNSTLNLGSGAGVTVNTFSTLN